MSEPPSDDGRRSRSDAASRLAAMLADTGDDLVLSDDPDEGSDERATGAPDGPSVVAIAARPAPVQPQPERPRKGRRAGRPAPRSADATDTVDEPTRPVDVADLLADDDPGARGGSASAPAGAAAVFPVRNTGPAPIDADHADDVDAVVDDLADDTHHDGDPDDDWGEAWGDWDDVVAAGDPAVDSAAGAGGAADDETPGEASASAAAVASGTAAAASTFAPAADTDAADGSADPVDLDDTAADGGPAEEPDPDGAPSTAESAVVDAAEADAPAADEVDDEATDATTDAAATTDTAATTTNAAATTDSVEPDGAGSADDEPSASGPDESVAAVDTRPAAAVAVASRSRADEDAPAPAPAPVPAPEPSAPGPEVRLRRVTLRSVAFGTVFALLVAAVPALAWVGKERLLDSKGGEVVVGGTDPDEPGYRALVVPTETGLVLQRDDEGTITATTLLALGAGESGGTVLQIPMNTKVREQKFLFDRLSVVAANSSDELYVREVADLLNVGIPMDNVVTIDDESLASLTAPVAPLAIDNPDPVLTDDGETIPAGPVELSADQVGPYLRASAGGEDELARLARNELVWSAWLAAVGEAGIETGVGQGFTDIGPFIRTLASGEAMVQTLNVTLPPESDQPDPPYVPAEGFDDQILDAVPYPTSPSPGRRWELVLLNGSSPDDEISRELMRELIGQGATLTTLGNAAAFGEEGTVVEYSGSEWRDAAERAAFVLGEGVEVERMSAARAEQAGADVVITLGSTTLDRFEEGG